ncbi:MAG: GH25 family lysozyme M1 (1,4-beta-N-acetylmuramidase) [Bacteriovoracaceae bacterium]|jgi:lysozyme
MKLTTITFIVLLFTTLLGCQEEKINYIKLDLKNNSYLIKNQIYPTKLSVSGNIHSATVLVNQIEIDSIKINQSDTFYNLELNDLGEDVSIEIIGHDLNGELIAYNHYSVHCIEDPIALITSPVIDQNVVSGEKIKVAGQFSEPISKVNVSLNGKVLAVLNQQNFDEYIYIESIGGARELIFSFQDKEGNRVKVETITINIDGAEGVMAIFNKTWEDENSSIVIDAYEGNSIDWEKMKTDQKVVGVIHRSSDGLRVDKKYFERKEKALKNGYLWGAYHLGRPGRVIEQARLLLDMTNEDDNTILILDLEATSSSNMMNIDEAVEFMNYVYTESGKIPVIYANHSVTKSLNQKLSSNILFKQAPLWYARFRSSIPDFPVGIWNDYFLWQFSSEINCKRTGSCLYNVPGTTSYMDINVYAGPKSKLRREWRDVSQARY